MLLAASLTACGTEESERNTQTAGNEISGSVEESPDAPEESTDISQKSSDIPAENSSRILVEGGWIPAYDQWLSGIFG